VAYYATLVADDRLQDVLQTASKGPWTPRCITDGVRVALDSEMYYRRSPRGPGLRDVLQAESEGPWRLHSSRSSLDPRRLPRTFCHGHPTKRRSQGVSIQCSGQGPQQYSWRGPQQYSILWLTVGRAQARELRAELEAARHPDGVQGARLAERGEARLEALSFSLKSSG